MNLLFCVHRTMPYPGGSEIYVQNMADECKRRGHNVAIFAETHRGNFNDINITNDANILLSKWDLVIVHGAGPALQNFVLSNAKNIKSKILYMIILPDESSVCLNALKDCHFISWSTEEDFNYIKKYGVENKAVRVRHGINLNQSLGTTGFKAKHNIQGTMFLSCGGYWPNKAMKELVDVFKKTNPKNATLVTTGYDNRMNLMPSDSDNVKNFILNDRQDVLSAIKDADCLVMHSYQEGFGLVLLEAMVNKTPWIARQIAGAKLMRDYGHTYTDDIQLVHEFLAFSKDNFNIDRAYDYAMNNHLIQHTIDDIEVIARQSLKPSNL
jgi:glycosyltransferase involved in cell wall biosynthesis